MDLASPPGPQYRRLSSLREATSAIFSDEVELLISTGVTLFILSKRTPTPQVRCQKPLNLVIKSHSSPSSIDSIMPAPYNTTRLGTGEDEIKLRCYWSDFEVRSSWGWDEIVGKWRRLWILNESNRVLPSALSLLTHLDLLILILILKLPSKVAF